MTAPYQVIPADLAQDRDAIIGVWQRNLTTDPSQLAKKFDWYYLANPLGPAHCWLLKSSDDTVGVAGLGLRQIRYKGQDLLAGLGSDFAVDVDHRSFHPAMSLQRRSPASSKTTFDLVYCLPNEKSLPIFKRLGYTLLGNLARQVKVLRTRGYIAKRTNPPSPQPSPAPSLTSPCAPNLPKPGAAPTAAFIRSNASVRKPTLSGIA